MSESSTVLPGLDRLYEGHAPQEMAFLRGQRLGLLTNHTGRTRNKKSTFDALRELGCDIRALFSPEHGIEGKREGHIHSEYSPEKLPIHSLYGDTRRPTPEMLRNIDLLVCDLQDVGARFYTYASTLAHTLEECARHSIGVVVLDRPNPIGGETIEGPGIDADLRSFIGYLDIPIRHGMTLGELSLLFCSDAGLSVQLRVIEVQSLQRELLWPETGLEWAVPSPNLPDFQSAAWYPGTCLLEFSKLSVGRGTGTPFQTIGAPWLDARKVLRELENEPLFTHEPFEAESIEFIPERGEHSGQLCQGIRFRKPEGCSPIPGTIVPLGLALLTVLHRVQPALFDEEKLRLALPLLGSSQILSLLQQGETEAAFQIAFNDAEAFRERRRPFLLYS